AQGFKMVIQFLSVIILARLLLPEDFGLVASVGPIVAFVGLLQNLGLQQALVQRKDISDRQLNQVFWISALVGLGSAVVVAALAPAIAGFYGDQRMLG
ncbi:MAG: lipopolysaccharide biosynthesis protein, partial [Mesorhizobium sp.]